MTLSKSPWPPPAVLDTYEELCRKKIQFFNSASSNLDSGLTPPLDNVQIEAVFFTWLLPLPSLFLMVHGRSRGRSGWESRDEGRPCPQGYNNVIYLQTFMPYGFGHLEILGPFPFVLVCLITCVWIQFYVVQVCLCLDALVTAFEMPSHETLSRLTNLGHLIHSSSTY